jgi:hypothetical protein
MNRAANRGRYLLLHITTLLSLVALLLAAGCSRTHPPVIFSITAEPDIVSPGEISTVTVEAGDMDGDELSYEWMVPAGRIEGSGKAVTWVSPETEGKYEVIVTVSDGSDSVAKTVAVTVSRNYYPLAVGNTWTFRDNNGNTINFEIVDTITIEGLGVTAFVKQMTSSGLEEAANFSYMAKNSDGVHQYGMGGSSAGGDTIIFSPELPIYKFPLVQGELWEVKFDVKVPEGYFVGEGTATYQVVSEEDLTVEAGSFQHVFQVKEDFTWELLGDQIDHIVTHHWLAPNVGIVKFVQEETIGGETVVTEAALQSYSLE